MNRSILIVICDFLLLSLLAFSSVDIAKVDTEGRERQSSEMATNRVDTSQDLGTVMQMALAEERKQRDVLVGELAKTRETAEQQKTLLSEREKQIQTYQGDIQTREQNILKLQQQQTALSQQFATAQTNIQSLNEKLASTSKEVDLSKEQRAALEAEARRQAEKLAALQQELTQLGKSNQMVLAEKQQLSTQLQVSEAEKRAAADTAARMQEQVNAERAEKEKLAEGVKALATKSTQLAQEIRENRPLAPNTIFNEFVSNRVALHLATSRSTLFGIDSNRQRDTDTILVTDGANIFALCHVQETPFVFSDPALNWDSITGTLGRGSVSYPIASLSFFQSDPRIVFMPVMQSQARDLGSKIYRISSDPYKFQDAVLIGAKAGYYGECKFQIDLSTPQYIKMDHSSIKGLFGKFNPSRGDLAFSKQGELLGIMANSTYCLLLQKFDNAATFQFGTNVKNQRTSTVLTRFYYSSLNMPNKLQ